MCVLYIYYRYILYIQAYVIIYTMYIPDAILYYKDYILYINFCTEVLIEILK